MPPTVTPSVTRPLRRAATLLTHPLLPEDFLGLVDPLRSAAQLRARVVEVRRESHDAVTLVLKPGRGWPGRFRAGQYVGVGVELDGVRHWRTYSLTSAEPAPGRPARTVAITVKAVGAASGHLVRTTAVGDVLALQAPAGDFVLPALPGPLLMVTAGSGITPVMAMLRTLVSRGALRDVVLLHSAPTPEQVLFGAELVAYDRAYDGLRLVVRHTATEGRLDLADLDRVVPDWRRRTTYACGPAGLLDAAERHWAQLPHQLHVERFAPALLPGAGGRGGPVTYGRAGVTVETDGSTSLLDAGEAAGVLLPSGCRMGICFGCVVPRTAGQVRDLRTGEVSEPDLVQTCISTAAGPCSLDV